VFWPLTGLRPSGLAAVLRFVLVLRRRALPRRDDGADEARCMGGELELEGGQEDGCAEDSSAVSVSSSGASAMAASESKSKACSKKGDC
jgi:hypothetical protein